MAEIYDWEKDFDSELQTLEKSRQFSIRSSILCTYGLLGSTVVATEAVSRYSEMHNGENPLPFQDPLSTVGFMALCGFGTVAIMSAKDASKRSEAVGRMKEFLGVGQQG